MSFNILQPTNNIGFIRFNNYLQRYLFNCSNPIYNLDQIVQDDEV